jgi:thiol:disulfide interchange protein DsbD
LSEITSTVVQVLQVWGLSQHQDIANMNCFDMAQKKRRFLHPTYLMTFWIMLVPLTSFNKEQPDSGVPVRVTKVSTAIENDGAVKIDLLLAIQEGWHVNSNTPKQPYLIPTRIIFNECQEITAPLVSYPPPEEVLISILHQSLSVYSREISFAVRGTLQKNKMKKSNCRLSIEYQACSDTVCLPPATIDVRLSDWK